MKAIQYMRRPFVVSGFQVTEDNMSAIAKWCEGNVITKAARPFVRVPVDHPTNRKQTEAYVGTWVLLSIHHGRKSYKVYTQEWLDREFIPLEIETDETSMTLPDDEEENSAGEISCCGYPHHHGPASVRAIPGQHQHSVLRNNVSPLFES